MNAGKFYDTLKCVSNEMVVLPDTTATYPTIVAYPGTAAAPAISEMPANVKKIVVQGTTAITITLPPPNVYPGRIISIYNTGAAAITFSPALVVNTGDTAAVGEAAERVSVLSDGVSWVVIHNTEV